MLWEYLRLGNACKSCITFLDLPQRFQNESEHRYTEADQATNRKANAAVYTTVPVDQVTNSCEDNGRPRKFEAHACHDRERPVRVTLPCQLFLFSVAHRRVQSRVVVPADALAGVERRSLVGLGQRITFVCVDSEQPA